ncbi:geranylgeranylglycerol-phosphate geranylgeranyltransferase [Gangjinia marincola]|uniref:Geranylgeranylglycerol-phosphate geranylgeranyltransferase n=1 Tax=Gangjinia marincola TaxID=578463 RepID=A0ABP3XPM1_9FLAO
MDYLNLIRWPNLLIVALTLLVIKYYFLIPFNAGMTLDDLHYGVLIFATLCITASGYVINDLYDIGADRINKPKRAFIPEKISEKTAFTLFIVFTSASLLSGFYLANHINQSSFAALFLIVSGLLYAYASYLKKVLLIGNIIVSGLVALVFLLPAIFDLLPSITSANRAAQKTLFNILTDYAVFAFVLNLIRELVKDQQDIDGDLNDRVKSLPIVLGRNRTNKIIFALILGCIALIFYYVYTYLFQYDTAIFYSVLLLMGPLLFCAIKVFTAERKRHYSLISLLLKIVMVFGICSLGLYKFLLL